MPKEIKGKDLLPDLSPKATSMPLFLQKLFFVCSLKRWNKEVSQIFDYSIKVFTGIFKTVPS